MSLKCKSFERIEYNLIPLFISSHTVFGLRFVFGQPALSVALKSVNFTCEYVKHHGHVMIKCLIYSRLSTACFALV